MCCVDEFETMRESDRAAIHEAMEQQSLSVAKAGMVTKLRARCSVIAATNLKSNAKRGQGRGGRGADLPGATMDVASMLSISSPLLSRFDLILVLRDAAMPEWDAQIADYVLDQHGAAKEGEDDQGREGEDKGGDGQGEGGPIASIETLRRYLSHCRGLRPSISAEAEGVLKGYYRRQRHLASQGAGLGASRTTIRMLESLARLSQAHARLMRRAEVGTADAVVAIALMEASTLRNVVQSRPPKDAQADYAQTEANIMRGLVGAM